MQIGKLVCQFILLFSVYSSYSLAHPVKEKLENLLIGFENGCELYKFIDHQVSNFDENNWDLIGYHKPLEILSRGGFQESVWALYALRYEDLALTLKQALTHYLENAPVTLKNTHLGKDAVDGMTEVYEASLPGGIDGYWKPKNSDWRSNYEHEIAGYQLDQLWKLNFVPITVLRIIDGTVGSLQIKVHLKTALAMGRDFKTPNTKMLVFDYLIRNTDRHLKNFGYLYDDYFHTYYQVAFDHSLAFFTSDGFFGSRKGAVSAPSLDQVLTEIRRGSTLYENIAIISDDELRITLKDYVTKSRIKALIKRKNELLTKVQ